MMHRKSMTEEMIHAYTRVAYNYHKLGMTQEEVSKKMSMSRQRVNRILSECLELGIVQVQIVNINENHLELEAQLEDKFKLKGVHVVDNIIAENIYEDLGRGAAEYAGRFIQDNDIIGFSRGRSTSAMVDYMPFIARSGLTVTQLLGSETSGEENLSADSIVYRFAKKQQAKSTMLYAPIVVQSKALRDSIMEDPYFTETYDTLKKCRIAIVGVGLSHDKEQYFSGLCEDEADCLKQMSEENIAGEVITHFFDKQGNPVVPRFRDRIISISLEDYLQIPIRLGVAGLIEKTAAIYAAIKGNYINVLVTDSKTAKELLQK